MSPRLKKVEPEFNEKVFDVDVREVYFDAPPESLTSQGFFGILRRYRIWFIIGLVFLFLAFFLGNPSMDPNYP